MKTEPTSVDRRPSAVHADERTGCVPLQTFSHAPSWPVPRAIRAWRSEPHACSYILGRSAELRCIQVESIPAELYQEFMDAGFRRSGKLIYQPVCSGCRRCVPIRVPVATFKPNKSQRRCWRGNENLSISVSEPTLTDEKFDLYCRYVKGWHRDRENDDASSSSNCEEPTREELLRFLYDSPVPGVEFEYRDPAGQLLAIGICDVCPGRSLSSVYFYFDPAESSRGLGTFGALFEIDVARRIAVPYYYLGYWIDGCRTMQYKSSFRPFELLGTDGVWRTRFTR